jgi:glycosyltransferase involved in cell wall biosynthesis
MKILLINAKPTLVDALSAIEGVEVVALWPRRHHFAHLPPPTSVPTRFYAGGNKLSLRAAWQLRRLIQSERPDVVHAFYARPLAHLLMAVTGLRRRPKIVSFRGITSPISVANAGDWLSYRHPLVDAHACESDAVRQALIRSGIDASRCHTVYNTMYSAVSRRPGRPALVQFDIPHNAFVIATVGAFRTVKGADLLLEAAIACADLKDVYWLLIGKVLDAKVERLAADVRIRDRVRLVGYKPDAAELVSGADLFVMPSRAEALCQALLEAMHQGVCPVVSDAGGMKEVVRHGQDGLVIPAGEVESLAAAVRKLCGDRALVEQFAKSAEHRIREMLTPVAMASRCVSVYQSLLSAQPRSTAA